MQLNISKDEQAQHATVSHCSQTPRLPHWDATPPSSAEGRCDASAANVAFIRPKLNLTLMEVLVLLQAFYHISNKSTGWLVAYLIVQRALWRVINVEMAFLCVCVFVFVGRSLNSFCVSIRFLKLSFWHQSADENTIVLLSTTNHREALCSPPTGVFSFAADGEAKTLPLMWGESVFPLSGVASAPGLKVNHRGLGQVFSSLENSLHMTHFRYPQILRGGREKKSPAHKKTHAFMYV